VPRQLTPRGERRRNDIIAFATARFAAQGYHPTSVGEIVDGLGVGKGVFYWYFSSKEELFRAILRDAQRDLRRRQKEAINDADEPLARIAQGIRASLQWSAEHRDLFALVAFAATDERFAKALRRGAEVAAGDAMRHVREAVEDGSIPDGDPVMLTHAMLGVTTELTRTMLHEAGVPADEVADVAVAFCIGGLLGRSASPQAR
jgi:AcrR family transcriptional regulator